MTNTETLDTDATVAQIQECVQAGATLVRMTAQGLAHASNLARIRRELEGKGVHVDLVADIHFNPAAAYEAAKHVEKVRINPGNFADPGRVFRKIEYTDAQYTAEMERLHDAFVPFLKHCRAHGTAIRLGVNHGSLSDRIMSRYGDTPEGMVESAMEYLRIARQNDFADIVISIKASNVLVMTRTVRMLVEAMELENMDFPLHLGVTEAGDGEDGRVKSAVGIGSLLADGIGDTIRVSLSEHPSAEIPVARSIIEHVERLTRGENYLEIYDTDEPVDVESTAYPYVLGYDTKHSQGTIACVCYPSTIGADEVVTAASIDLGRLLLTDRKIDGISIQSPHLTAEQIHSLALAILQATRRRMSKTEIIACPGCGRTLFDLSETLRSVKDRFGHLPGLKIAVMGCIVNGPGEMADADYGYVGGAKGRVSVYRCKECIHRNLSPAEALDALQAIMEQDGYEI